MSPQAVGAPEPKIIESLKVIDEDGKPCPAYDRYKRETITVLCNQTGGNLRLPMSVPGGIVWMKPGESLDLEDLARPSAIDFSGINRMTTPTPKGYVAFTLHEKNSKPVGRAKFEQSGPIGEPNGFDEALDAREQKDIDEDERTSRRRGRRTGPGGAVTRAQESRTQQPARK